MYNPYDRLLDKLAYITGLIILLIGICGIFIINKYDIDLDKYIQPCLINQLTGLYCPGCGGTRALKYLLGGHIFKSLYYNPAVAYVFFPWIWFIATHSVHLLLTRLGKHNVNFMSGRILHPITVKPVFLYTGIIIFILQCLIKNLIFILFSVSPI